MSLTDIGDLIAALPDLYNSTFFVQQRDEIFSKQVTATAKDPVESNFKYKYNIANALITGYTNPAGLACKHQLQNHHVVRYQFPNEDIHDQSDWHEFPPAGEASAWKHQFIEKRPLTIVAEK